MHTQNTAGKAVASLAGLKKKDVVDDLLTWRKAQQEAVKSN
jgi:hypothetical protein